MRRTGWIGVIAALVGVFALVTPALAAEGGFRLKSGKDITPTYVEGKTGSVYLNYQDADDASSPVSGAEFTYYRVAELEGFAEGASISSAYRPLCRNADTSYIHVDDKTNAEDIADDIVSAYKEDRVEDGVKYEATTNDKGCVNTTNMRHGVYLAVETKAAKMHLPTAPFIFAVPYAVADENVEESGWCYEAYVEPKPNPCGNLIVKKIVSGTAGDKEKDFHFTFTINSKEKFNYHKYKAGKKPAGTGSIESGDSFTLRHGEYIEIDTIPTGTEYQIVEEESGKDGYKTSVDGEAEGRIGHLNVKKVTFTNKKDKAKKKSSSSSGNGSKKKGFLSSVQTGDENMLLAYMLLAEAGLMAICIAVMRRRKERAYDDR